jgi:trk system potassium uptake protein
VNYLVIAKLVGLLLMVFGLSMAPALMWGLYYRDGSAAPLVFSMALTVAVGGGLFLLGRSRPQEIFRKEATATVGLAWLMSTLAGALPYRLARLPEMPTFADCFFESMSGLTTTGASILGDIESLPPGILFWRSWTHWLGGLGIIMLFVAVLPYLGAGGRALVKSEITGPVKEGLTPRIKDTALLLSRLYIGYTAVQTLLLMLAGMNLFDALCHTFGTVASAGFSTKNDSIGHFYHIGAIEVIILVFMLLAGMNFALMYSAFSGRAGALWRDAESRAYFGVIAASTLFVAIVLIGTQHYSVADAALRDALFTVVSIATTTGFVTADFELWPTSAQVLLALVMFVGGCAGSTAGGLKIVRWLILLKVALRMIEKVYRPRSVRQIRVGSLAVPDEIQEATIGLFLLWLLVFGIGAFALALLEGGGLDLVTAFSASASTLNNIGPGFAMVGATENYGFFSPASKWLLSLLMLLGRLELYSILVLFAPHFWRRQ